MSTVEKRRFGGSRRAVLSLCVVLAVLAPAVPARAHHRPAPPQPAPLVQVPDLLSGLLSALFPPAGGAGLAPSVQARVTASTVRIAGPACGAVQVGSGFSARPDIAVTAAHVVAGVTRPEVLRPDGRRLPATVVAFDPDKDLAVLRVDGLGQAPLPLGKAVVGSQGAVFGHPNGQTQVEVSPATVVAQGTARLEDLYGEDIVSREILRLDSRLEPGDSGGPVVDGAGTVVGVAFAVSTLRPDVAYAVSTRELEPLLAQPSTTRADTGPCIS